MLTSLLDFFCSQPFPEAPKRRMRIFVACSATLWAVIAYVTGWILCEDVAMPGVYADELQRITGAVVETQTGFPLLQGVMECLIGTEPSLLAVNLFGAALTGLLLAMTWLLTFFWMRDAMTDDSIVGQSSWVAAVGAHVVCALFLLSLGGLYTVSVFSKDIWCFALLLLCAVLQNAYAMNGGRRWMMAIFAVVLGVALVESPWVLLLLPVVFVRTLMMEWRLWDHRVRNLPVWFIGVVAGALLALLYGASRLEMPLLEGLKVLYHDLPRLHYYAIADFILGVPWLWNVLLAVAVPFLVWVTARRLLNNDRKWVLLFTAIVLTGAIFALYYGLLISPVKLWLLVGRIPMATTWMFSVACGMLILGWGVQLFARNPNLYEELDRRHMPAYVRALRVGAMIFFPLTILVALTTMVVHGVRFSRVDLGLMDRFAQETIEMVAKGSGSPAEGHCYILGTSWIDSHLMLMAKKRGVSVTVLSPDRMGDTGYIGRLEATLMNDPVLGDIDRKRLCNLLKHHGLLLFLIDFFAAQPNIEDIALVYNYQEIWRDSVIHRLQPMPYGTIYLGVPVGEKNPIPAYDVWRNLVQRWRPILDCERLPWYDTNADDVEKIRHHIAFMSNNMGVFLDDQSALKRNDAIRLTQEIELATQAGNTARVEELEARRAAILKVAQNYHLKAAECYLAAYEIEEKNLSALLNLTDLCRSNDTLLPEKREEIYQAMVAFTEKSVKDGRKYVLPAIQRHYGTIRNEALLINYGPIWSLTNAPASLLAGLYTAQSRLAPTDPRNAMLQSAIAEIREMQGQRALAIEDYRAALKHNAKDVTALRAMARLSIQEGNLEEAEKYLLEAEKVFDEATVATAGAEDTKAARAAFDLDRAAYYMAKGDVANANKMLGTYTTENPDSVIGWTMLGMLRIEDWARTGQEHYLKEASGHILQSVRRTIKENADRYFQHILEARLAQVDAEKLEARARELKDAKSSKLREDAKAEAIDAWHRARNNYRQAHKYRPHVKGILELILDIDRRLQDKHSAEADAIALLREDPRHPFANFIVGSQRLEDGDVNAALIYFKNAVEGEENPAVDVLTNYADALSRTAQRDLACEMGKRATELAPMSYATWGTYALALARHQRVAEAKLALAKANDIIVQMTEQSQGAFKPDPRLSFVNIWIAVAEQNRREAESLTADLRAVIGTAQSPLDKLDFQDVDRAIQSLPSAK